MKALNVIFTLILLFMAASAQDKPPVIKSNSRVISVQDGEVLRKNYWTLTPQAKPDVYTTVIFKGRPRKVSFISDVDSISYDVREGKKYDFVVQWGEQLCYVQINTLSAKSLLFTKQNETLAFVFQRQPPTDSYLTRLRSEYKLDEVVAGKKNEYEKVRAISKWVRSRWEHNGSNEPQKSDPISILQEASEGKRFRCVEYSIVLAAALNSTGISARVLSLKTEDAETRESGAGHVVAEAYHSDLKKWIMVDGQWDVIPTLNGKPLNAVEFQKAIIDGNPGLSVDSFSSVATTDYLLWVAPYLFYFGTQVDSGEHELILKPVGAKDLQVFQRRNPMKNAVFTTSLKTFYGKPKI